MSPVIASYRKDDASPFLAQALALAAQLEVYKRQGVACTSPDSRPMMAGACLLYTSVLDAIAAGDAPRAQQALREHLSGTLSQVAEICKRYPDYVQAD